MIGFFEDLYGGFSIHKVLANRRINSNGAKRGPITELYDYELLR